MTASDSNVIQFGDMALRRKHSSHILNLAECQHTHVTLDATGEVVTCDKCARQLSAFWVLGRVVDQWAVHAKKADFRAKDLADKLEKNVGLLAAQRVEKAWRSHTMVPSCPHCYAGIFPQDGFGGSMINKQIELRRREAKRTEKL